MTFEPDVKYWAGVLRDRKRIGVLDVVKATGMSERAVRNWCKDEKIKSTRDGQGYNIDLASLTQFLLLHKPVVSARTILR